MKIVIFNKYFQNIISQIYHFIFSQINVCKYSPHFGFYFLTFGQIYIKK